MHFINKGDIWPTSSNKPNDPFILKNYWRIGKILKRFFTTTNKMLGRNEPLPLPPSDDLGRLAQEFSDFFRDKINNIMLQLKPTPDCLIDNRYIED